MGYSGSIDLISGIRQINGGTFPLVDASAVRVDDETRLDAKLANITDDVSNHDVLSKLTSEEIPNTTQELAFDGNGNISSITHIGSSNNTIRTDLFTFGESTITEVRTLYTGDVLTIVTNTSTLQTTVTFTGA